MRIGYIGYANNSGIGNMGLDLIEQFNIDYHFIVNGEDKGTNPSLSKASNKVISDTWLPDTNELIEFLKQIDIIITIETTYHPDLFKLCKEYNVRSIMIPMWEWFEWGKYSGADMYICTSRQTYEYLIETVIVEDRVSGDSIVHIPWAIDTDKFKFRLRGEKPNVMFLHNAGFGGLNCRKGTIEVVSAFNMIKNKDLILILNSQRPLEFFPQDIQQIIKTNIQISFNDEDVKDNAALYDVGDVYLYPARYDGQALVAQEALACGLPTFVTDAPPMNEFGTDEFFKLPIEREVPIRIHNHSIDMNLCHAGTLAKRIDECFDLDLKYISNIGRKLIEEKYSWNALRDKYVKAIYGTQKEERTTDS